MITLPPGEPTIISPSGFSTNVGVMLDSGRLPGAIAFASAPISRKPFGTPGFAAKSSISLFSMMPVPGTMRPEPKKKLIDWCRRRDCRRRR